MLFFAVMDFSLELKKELSDYLVGFISEKRKKRFDEVISERTSHIRIVLEDVYQAHNASAVLRSCDCFGIQHVHFIENKNNVKISEDVAMGSSNWLSIYKHREGEHNTREALENLRSQGYRIIATTPHTKSYSLKELPVDKKFALVFGTEITGISKDVYELSDEFVQIPMYGFTESFNISVCAALCMYELSEKVRAEVKDYKLSVEEKTEIYFDWLRTSIESSEGLIGDYLRKRGL
jgi:tRNA (guanosine-2'-O-)-methyltransferase